MVFVSAEDDEIQPPSFWEPDLVRRPGRDVTRQVANYPDVAVDAPGRLKELSDPLEVLVKQVPRQVPPRSGSFDPAVAVSETSCLANE